MALKDGNAAESDNWTRKQKIRGLEEMLKGAAPW